MYGSNVGCPNAYAAADRLARNEVSDGFDGLISDAFVDADYESQPYEGADYAYKEGVFTFHVATNTLLPTSGDQSPYSTVCVMLYSGEPASSTPSRNIVLETTRHALVSARGSRTPSPDRAAKLRRATTPAWPSGYETGLIAVRLRLPSP